MAVAGSLTYDTKLETKGFNNGLSKLGGATSAAFKGVGLAVGATVTAIGGLTVASTNAYAEYEQLVGGVDTLFKDSSKDLQKYADEAYKTAGLSANEYMSTATSFSASLLQSLGGDTEKAVEYANSAIIDMSDNANKMGTDMEAIQNAYQGFAKQNFTMLDNLKLGYGGTKEEMQRLLDDAEKLSGLEFDISSFGDITQAIHIVQENMGIAGTTAEEASTTISGSINTMKSAFDNLLVGLASGDADLETLINNLFTSVSTVMANLAPVVMTILEQVPVFIEQLVTLVIENLPTFITETLPSIISSAVTILETLIQGIQDNLDIIISGAMTIIETLVTGILPLLPQILETGILILVKLIEGISEMLPELIPQMIDAIILMVETLIDNIDLIIDAGIDLIMGLVEGLVEAMPILIDKMPVLIDKLITAITENLPKIIEMGITLLIELGKGLIKGIPDMIKNIPKVIKSLVEGFTNMKEDMKGVGKNLIEGLWNGIKNAKDWVIGKIKGFGDSILGGIKDFFGIKSPSKVFRDEVGQWLPKGMAVGIEANTDTALNSIDQMNDEIMDKMNQAVNMETARASFSGTNGSVSQILSANSMIQVENYNKLYLDGEEIYENQQTVQQRKNLQYGFGGGTSK